MLGSAHHSDDFRVYGLTARQRTIGLESALSSQINKHPHRDEPYVHM